MLNRTVHRWVVTLANTKSGESVQAEAQTFWNPEADGAAAAIANAVAASATVQTGAKHLPVNAERLAAA